jgi:uncharacterized surface protein with fasciclin (FAS1) repeats
MRVFRKHEGFRMHLRTVTLAAAAALFAGSALAQPAAPAEPAAPAPEVAALAAPPEPPSAAAVAYKPIAPAGNVRATLEASGQFSKFLAAVDKTGLGAFLVGEQALTYLVPTDTAFDTLPNLAAMMEANPATDLQRVLLKHIINAKVAPEQVNGAKGPVPTVGQVSVEIDGSVTPMKIDQAVVLQNDVQATNGVIYVIDRTL